MDNRIKQIKRKFTKTLILIGILCLSLTALPTAWPDTRVEIDSVKVAAAETNMWRAYYSGNLTILRTELINLLRSQFGLSHVDALDVGAHFSSAAMIFESTRGNYKQTVLPGLVRAYSQLKDKLSADFDPEEAARAELDWWAARRTPGKDSPEAVGQLIAHLYAVVFGGDQSMFESAGLLRAQAAHLRDKGGAQCDWGKVESLLLDSYQALQEAHSGLASQEEDSSEITAEQASSKTEEVLDNVEQEVQTGLSSSQEKSFPEFATKVQLSVSGDKNIKDLIENYMVKELRSNGDVVVTDTDPEWVINILAKETAIKEDKSSVVISVVILRPFGTSIMVSIDSRKKSSVRKLVRLHDQRLYIYSIDAIDKLCLEIVADYRNEHLNPERERVKRIQESE